ncbi:hypothetical protein F5148DRAFT_977834 [Russula earlei]|uniref:Uncharacterized protein n=1 Tax=Russula earlei TaxID=71964 RepID=A0ACC0UDZ7_9AGAM|nr:hypothetical protein F5148DRAFT_977834 [Russula earlei]
MELPESPSSHQFSTRKPGEPGLAEWAQKIRALQRQVDDDEEEEHRKLEQEIAASRLARVRRSAGYGRSSLDPVAEAPSTTSRPSEALQKPVSKPSHFTQTAPSSPVPISLAAIIGGRATGPRLNKQAPQLDATDATLFEQRSIISSSAPHPVFGRGGTAMPGLTSRGRSVVSPTQHDEVRSPTPTASLQGCSPVVKNTPASSNTEPLPVSNGDHRSGCAASRQPLTGTPSAALKRYVQHVEQVASTQASKPSLEHDVHRPRTVSTPSGTHPTLSTTLPLPIPQSRSSHPASSHAHVTSRSPECSPSSFDSNIPLTKSLEPRSSKSSLVTPKKSAITSVPSPASSAQPPTSSVSAPSPPRPEALIPRGHSLTPQQRSLSLYPRKEKDPTPSISRLKGRGFVKSMVKASSDLEAAAAGSALSEVEKLSPTKRPPSVAGRWQPESSLSSKSHPAPTPAPTNFRKSWAPAAATPSTQGTAHTGRSIRNVASPPSFSTPSRPSTPPASPGGYGLGSSSTLFSYIKPTKTGDDSSTGHPRPHSRPTTPASACGLTSTQDADELGHRTGASLGGQRQRRGMAGIPPPSGRALVHLTKGRAKPKKANRKNTGEQLAKTRAIKTHASPPRVPDPRPPAQSAITTHSHSPVRITPTSTCAINALFHADAPTQPRIHPPARKADRSTTVRFDEQALIGVSSSDSTAPLLQEKSFPVGLARPSPGPSTPPPSLPRPLHAPHSSATLRSPRRQSRIPSTGSRTLVMDVAQTLHEAQVSMTKAETTSTNFVPLVTLRQVKLEKRKSRFDECGGRSMSPLVEERTLMTRGVHPELVVQTAVDAKPGLTAKKKASPDHIPLSQQDDNLFEILYRDEPLPQVDLEKLLLLPSQYQPSAGITISVDVMSVSGATATSLKGDINVFYDSEILAIVHRIKAKSSGLVETTLWGWQGRRSQIGEREQRKLKDMARHYGTKLCLVHQGCEPQELVHALNGRLATRQGARSYWSVENTTMHQVRLMDGNIFIDEHDFHVSNLCSAFSYCLTLLGTLYVWHGKGSLPEERQAALGYALSLPAESCLVELIEHESDNNEVFWMMLGDADYASADYWKWRPDLATALPRIWRVDASSDPHLTTVLAFSTESKIDLSVYLLDCIWELFVVVGMNARKARQDIRLALSVAKDVSSRIATSRPFMPPIHVLILPSKIPLDLRQHFRDLDEERVNGTFRPDHMNLLELAEALTDLETIRWEKTRLDDLAMLPLGMDPTCLS